MKYRGVGWIVEGKMSDDMQKKDMIVGSFWGTFYVLCCVRGVYGVLKSLIIVGLVKKSVNTVIDVEK